VQQRVDVDVEEVEGVEIVEVVVKIVVVVTGGGVVGLGQLSLFSGLVAIQ